MVMSSSNNPYGNTELVDRLLGTAYINVKAVADNLKIVKHVSANLPIISDVDDNITAINSVYQNITSINNLYNNMATITTALADAETAKTDAQTAASQAEQYAQDALTNSHDVAWATSAQTIAGTSATTVISPSTLKAAYDSWFSSAAYATAAQGAKADTALQPADLTAAIGSTIASQSDVESAATDAETALSYINANILTRADFVSGVAAGTISFVNNTKIMVEDVKYIASSGATAISDLPGWLPYEQVTPDHFGSTQTTDAGPMLRAARDYVKSLSNGGVITLLKKYYKIASTETVTVKTYDDSTFAQITSTVAVWCYLPANVSLVGTKHYTKLYTTAGSTYAYILGVDYANAKIEGFEIQGAGASSTSAHGIFLAFQSSYDYVQNDIQIKDMKIGAVGSYGIGSNVQCKNVRLSGIAIDGTGADGIDWKIRGSSVAAITDQTVVMENIEIRNWAQRSGAGTPTGIGVRGPVQMNNIAIYDIPDDLQGIDFVAGVASSGDFRLSSQRSTITNWYCEATNPAGTATALRIYSTFAVEVGPGIAKWCKVTGEPASTTPYSYDDSHGGSIRGVSVIPAHGRVGFYITGSGTALSDCRVFSDIAYFDAARQTLTAGQTVFTLPWTSTAVNTIVPKVVKNGTALTVTTDYTLSDTTLTLVTAVASTDIIEVVFPPQRGYRIECNYVSLWNVREDRWVGDYSMFDTTAHADTSSGQIIRDGKVTLSQIDSTSVTGWEVRGGSATNTAHRIRGKGTGGVEIDRPKFLNLSTYADNASAIAGGLTSGMQYRTSTGATMTVY